MTIDDLKLLTPVELDLISTQIYKLIKDKITDQTSNYDNYTVKPKCCPHCGSILFVKNGFNKKHRQKFKCKDCKKIFSYTTGTLFFHSISNYNLWKNFIACEINGLTLEQERIQIGRCKTTCFNMRHKLYNAIKDIVFGTKLTGLTEIDASYTKINLKGTKKEKMPRFSKKRGNKSAYRGISHHKICLISAVDEYDNIIYRISGLGSESKDKYSRFKDCFSSNCTLVSDSKPCIKNFAKDNQLSIEQIPVKPINKRYTTNSGKTISTINQIHSELSILITKKHGISTRHLQDYLNWLVFCKYLKYKVKPESRFSDTYIK